MKACCVASTDREGRRKLRRSGVEAWIFGATGLVGQALVGELCARPEATSVTAFVRRAEGRAEPRLEERVVAFDRLDLELAGRTATHVFCCLGTTMAKAGSERAFRKVDFDYPLTIGRAALAAGAKKLLVVTAVGADPGSRIFYNRVKGELERALEALGLPELHLFRPSLILGDRSERRVGEKIAMVAARPVGALLVGQLKKYRPIAAIDIARAMVEVALSSEPAQPVNVYEFDRLEALARPSRASS
jgi:uncharacterized protein YbjT (DUF2867 family)